MEDLANLADSVDLGELSDVASDAAGEIAEFALPAAGGGFGLLPGFVQRWILLAAGMALGGYLLLKDGAVTGTVSDMWGAGLLVGSPVFLFLIPRWWHNI